VLHQPPENIDLSLSSVLRPYFLAAEAPPDHRTLAATCKHILVPIGIGSLTAIGEDLGW
jgi:hypothetical protein